MALAKLVETNNFGIWLAKINEIIDSLGASETLANQLLEALTEAIERNQITDYLGNPNSTTVTLPDGTVVPVPAGTWPWDWNKYTKNGVYWIPWVSGKTLNPPLAQQKSGMCWVASGGEKGPTLQLAAIFKDSPAAADLPDTPTLCIRYGAKGTSVISWKNWIEIPNRGYLDGNFLNFNKTTLQTIKGPIKFLENVEASKNLTVNGTTSVKKLVLKGASKSVTVYPDDSTVSNGSGTRFTTFEVVDGNAANPNTNPNLPLWSMSTGAYIQPEDRTRYAEPIWIDKIDRIANINGTAEYANFITPTNMVSKFKSSEIPYDQLWMPVTAKALKDLYDWTIDSFLPLKGGVLTGVVRHEDDIFLEHLKGVQENRTAAIRSVVRPLQMQCQGSTHLVSNSKQACLYLEKEDADSAEFTTEHHDASFVFRKVRLTLDMCMDNDPNFVLVNSYPEQEGYWNCNMTAGILKLFVNGRYEFTAKDTALAALGVHDKLEAHIFYSVLNAVTDDIIARNCQLDLEWHSGDDPVKSGDLTINDLHYQVAITDTDWLGLPITQRSKLASGSAIALGSLVKKNSVLNGYTVATDWIVDGAIVSYGNKRETSNGTIEETPAVLMPGSIIKIHSLIKTGSVINGERITNPTEVNSDILIEVESTLTKGTFLNNGTKLALNSVLNGYQYIQDEVITKYDISEESDLAVGSRLLLGTLISSDSAINGLPGKIGFLEVVCGANASERNGILASGSTILKGSTLAPGTRMNGVTFASPTTLGTNRTLTEDMYLGQESVLAVGSTIAGGSILAPGTTIGGITYESPTFVTTAITTTAGLSIGNGSRLAAGSIILKQSSIAEGRVVEGVSYESPTLVDRNIYVDGEAVIGYGSRLAAGSWIEVGSILNGYKWATGMRAGGLNEIKPLSEEDLAPILYMRTYDNIHERWESNWEKSTYREVFPTAVDFDADMWKQWISTQLDSLETAQQFRNEVLADLDKSLNKETRNWTYPIRTDVDTLLVNGKWRLNIESAQSPDHVFETRCYVTSHSKTIGVEKITVQPFVPVYDASGAIVGRTPAHDPATIFDASSARHPNFLGHAFEYFNFSVVPGMGSEYVVSYDTRLIPEQYNLSQDKVMEIVEFKAYSNDISSSGFAVATFEEAISLNITDMMGAPFVFGARTRTGITSTGQLGDPLYDLGCLEISEDTVSLKLRKRSVTMQSEIKETVALQFERATDLDSTINFPAGTMQRKEAYTFRPSVSSEVDLGTGDLRFRNVYLTGDPIVSSDKSLKTEIAEFPESLLKKWSKVKWMSFKFKDAVEAKGDDARIHSGVIAQDVRRALTGMDISKWSFFCKDKWEDRKEVDWVEVPAGKDEFGVYREAHTERRVKVSRKAGEQYSIRYQEMQCIENAYLRREIELLKEEIKELRKAIKR